MQPLKLGVLTEDVKCWQGFDHYGVFRQGWTVVYRGYTPTNRRHFAVCNSGTATLSQHVYFCDEADLDAALYSPMDAIVDAMINTGVKITDLTKHYKADQL